VFDHSLPVLSGYSIRSKSIVEAQQKLGHRIQVLTGTAHQLDDPTASDTALNGILYHRTTLPNTLSGRAIIRRWPLLREVSAIWLLRQRILEVLERAAFDVIHAHSPSLCGLAAWSAAAARHLPFVYEIRGFWEESAVDQNRIRKGSPRYIASRRLEEFVVRRADGVVGISRNILADLQARGIEPRKLWHVSNGVDIERFRPLPRDTDLSRRLDLVEGEPVLGFIGSLWKFEGISWLVRALAQLRQRGARFRVLIVGAGEEAVAIRAAIKELSVEDLILFPGPVSHNEVHRYYSVMDILVYPRRRIRLTERVTPLKPLEALAQSKAVLGSNVGGIRELVEPEETGLLFNPDDIDDFCRQAARLIANPDLRQRLGECGRQAILRKWDWKLLVHQYDAVYEAAINRHRAAAP
jgi:PEP-CTERM/exosortase A-associated glycosyltransferase